MKILRIVVKVPQTAQTAHDSWQDTTYFRSVSIPAPAELLEILGDKNDCNAPVVWCAIVEEGEK